MEVSVLVAASFGAPAVMLWLALRRGGLWTQFAIGLLVSGLNLALFAAGWLAHEAAYSGWALPYIVVTWTGVLWGGAVVRIHDNRRLMASQQLINIRISKLEQFEEQMQMTPTPRAEGGCLSGEARGAER